MVTCLNILGFRQKKKTIFNLIYLANIWPKTVELGIREEIGLTCMSMTKMVVCMFKNIENVTKK